MLEVADRWGDDELFGSHAEARFEETVWDTDEWDLPAPVPSLPLPIDAVNRFAPRAAIIAANVVSTRPVDRAAAESGFAAHWTACRYSDSPPVTWCASPGAALDALAATGAGSARLRRDLCEKPFFVFDGEATVRLNGSSAAIEPGVWRKGSGTAIASAVWRLTGAALGHDPQHALLDLVVTRGVQPGFDYMGLAADHARLAFYEFLRVNGAELSETAATFCAMTSSVWLMFPTAAVAYAVDRPIAAEATDDGLTLVFSDNDRLLLPCSVDP